MKNKKICLILAVVMAMAVFFSVSAFADDGSASPVMPEFYSSLGDVPSDPERVVCYFINRYDGSPAVISRSADDSPWKIAKYNGRWCFYMLGMGNDALCSDTCVYTTDPSKVTADGKIIDGLSDDIMELNLGDYFFFGEPYVPSAEETTASGSILGSVGDVASGVFDVAHITASTIVSTPLLLLFAVGLPVISFGVGLIIRIKSRA